MRRKRRAQAVEPELARGVGAVIGRYPSDDLKLEAFLRMFHGDDVADEILAEREATRE